MTTYDITTIDGAGTEVGNDLHLQLRFLHLDDRGDLPGAGLKARGSWFILP